MAAALIATLRIGAESFTATIFNGTLIDVNTVQSVLC